MQTPPTYIEEALERFDDEFPYDTLVSAHQSWTYGAIKSFLKQELQTARDRALEEVEREVEKITYPMDRGWPFAKREVLSILTSLKNK